MPGLLKLTLALGFHLEHRNNLNKGHHHFGFGQHTFNNRNVLKACVDQHQVIAGNGAAPSLADANILTDPGGVSLLSTLSMVWGTHMWLRVVLVTLFGPDHPITLLMKEVNT